MSSSEILEKEEKAKKEMETQVVEKELKPPLESRIGRDAPFTFGTRYLTNGDEEVWNHNAWDHVEWGDEQVEEAMEKIKLQHENPVSEKDKQAYMDKPARYWDLFYKSNRDNFFKDRKWLQIEFPSLFAATYPDAGPKTVFEIGCGAGNTMFPILKANQNPQLRVIGADFSPRAVQLVKDHELYDGDKVQGYVWDLANPENSLPPGVEEHSVDIAVMIFVFSALAPNQWDAALKNLEKLLKPGGTILFRDYGRYDLTQVRFKKNRLLDDNFYIRGDGTRVYFFEESQLREIFGQRFIVDKVATDRRLLVNRQRKLKMYRIWMQAVFRVPS